MPAQSALDLAGDLVGCLAGGPNDLASNPIHLADFSRVCPMHILLDTGPWVALLCKDVQHHEWAKQQFANYTGPFLTCEAVAAETCFLLARGGSNAGRALALIERGVVQSGMALSQEIAPVRELYQRYDNLPASLADACLVRMSELYEPCAVLTLESDFHVYRRHGRKVIPMICPDR